jgi:hypothetical protein
MPSLARLELRVVLAELLTRTSRFRLSATPQPSPGLASGFWSLSLEIVAA